MERVAQRHLCQAGHGDDVSGVEGHDEDFPACIVTGPGEELIKSMADDINSKQPIQTFLSDQHRVD